MTGTRLLVPIAALTLALLAPSCRIFRKSSKSAHPAKPQVMQPLPPPAQPQEPQEVELPNPPEISPQHPDLTQEPPVAETEKLPPAPTKPNRRPTRPREPQEAAQQPAPPAAQAPALPQLEQILSPEQRQAYNDEIDRNIVRAQKTVETLQGRRLNNDQKTYLARIQTFIEQASEARKTDLFRAKNLSERASVLAEDLMRSTQ